MSKEDIDAAVKAAEQFAEEDKKRREEVDTKNSAEHMCYTAEKMINENGDKLDEADKSEINAKIASLKETMQNGTVDTIKAGMDELQKALYKAGEKLYQAQAQQAGPQAGPQGYPGAGGPQAGANYDGGNVYDADYKDVD